MPSEAGSCCVCAQRRRLLLAALSLSAVSPFAPAVGKDLALAFHTVPNSSQQDWEEDVGPLLAMLPAPESAIPGTRVRFCAQAGSLPSLGVSPGGL